MAGVLFEDIFDVKDIDPEGKKFDRGKSCSGYRSFLSLKCILSQDLSQFNVLPLPT